MAGQLVRMFVRRWRISRGSREQDRWRRASFSRGRGRRD